MNQVERAAPQSFAGLDTVSILVILDEARKTLALAGTHAQILEAREIARVAFEEAKSMARMAKARRAHVELTQSLKELMGEAVAMQFLADARLADEVDAAQERGELKTAGQPSIIPGKNNTSKPSLADAGLTPKAIHEARKIRNAIEARPEVVNEVLTDMIEGGREISEAAVRREIGERGGMTSAEQSAKHEATMAVLRALDRDALFIMGHLGDFEERGVLTRDLNAIFGTMSASMQERTRRLAGELAEWLASLA